MKPIFCRAGILGASFALSPLLHADLTYVDAVDDVGGNTTLSNGTTLVANDTTGATTWRQRDNVAFGSGPTGSVFEGVEPSPEIKTTLTGLTPGAYYKIHVHFWDPQSTAEDWNVRAGFSSGSLTTFSREAEAVAGSVASVLASTLTYSVPPTLFGPSGARDMLAGELGIATADGSGSVVVFLDDFGSTNVNLRTWYDGLSYEQVPDDDGDGLPNDWEILYGLDPNDSTGDDGASGDPDGDGLTNLQEFLDSGTDPTDPDSDDDGANDGAESAAATNPHEADTDGDTMDDGYELLCQTPGTALDPLSDDSAADNDGDSLSNLAEYNPALGPNVLSVRTRADLADTDADGYSDAVEDNFGSWDSASLTGTNPTLADTDGDGLLDGQENYDLSTSNGGGGFPGMGVTPTNSEPNVADTDGDSFIDSYEVAQGTDPDDIADLPVQASGFTLVENFEGAGMTIGQTFVGVNGWNSGIAGIYTVADEPIAGGDQVGSILRPANLGHAPLSKSLAALGLQVREGNTGTLFFQVYLDSATVDHSFGLSDLYQPTGIFPDYEAQFANVGAGMGVRANTGYQALSTHRNREWMNVWIVADNATDQVRIHVQSPDGETGQVQITAAGGPYGFRNGTTAALNLLLLMENAGANIPVYVDNFYLDPTSENLGTPAAAKPVPLTEVRITNVFFDGGDLKISFAPGGAGFILTSSDNIVAPFAEETNALYDGVDTFTVPSAFLNAGHDFFRVETP